MVAYKDFKPTIANSVIKALHGQAWYLTPHLVVLSLVDDDLPSAERKEIAEKLLSHQVPQKFSVGRPNFPVLTVNSKLCDFVDENAWFLFKVKELDEKGRHDWLYLYVNDWGNISDYQQFKAFIEGIDVVNDRAERGVKLIQDFVHASRNEEDLQDLLHVVKNESSKI